VVWVVETWFPQINSQQLPRDKCNNELLLTESVILTSITLVDINLRLLCLLSARFSVLCCVVLFVCCHLPAAPPKTKKWWYN
jgi:hypothetical protein